MLISSSLIADVSFKIIFVGDSDVGKSALINRFKNDTFESNSRPTIGVEFAKRIVNFRRSNQNIQIHLWDTAGQERYKSITKQHYRGADSALIIFDLDKPTSFASTIQWINEARDNSPPNCIIGLVGNKADISNEISREVSREALRFALENRILYFETSARWNRGEETDPDRPFSKGVENVIFDTIENVGFLNPRKAISVQEKDSQFDGEEEGVTIGSMYELTRTQISLNNPFADTLPSGLNLKGSSALPVKEVKSVNLNIRSEKPAENTGCSCT